MGHWLDIPLLLCFLHMYVCLLIQIQTETWEREAQGEETCKVLLKEAQGEGQQPTEEEETTPSPI